ncbi:hypothetical protein [Enterovibrio calviensis]|uniref:hypothetical protein n=1 Tax=Enterovibrio calviensis TaxID=91359 RepID=UPI00048766D5|nr:hypothetical protein [Enterovibrio calviensis]
MMDKTNTTETPLADAQTASQQGAAVAAGQPVATETATAPAGATATSEGTTTQTRTNSREWVQVDDPASFRSRQSERRAFYTSLLETGNLGSAYKSMYQVEEDLAGKYERNQMREQYLQEGNTWESVQDFVLKGDSNVLKKKEPLKTQYVSLPDGSAALINTMTGQQIQTFDKPPTKAEIKTQLITNNDGSSFLINSEDGATIQEFEAVGKTAEQIATDKATAETEKEFNTGLNNSLNTYHNMFNAAVGINDADIKAISGWEHAIEKPELAESTKTAVGKFNRLISNQFLQQIDKMKGMGALSNSEGGRLSGAINSLIDTETGSVRKGLSEEHVRQYMQEVNSSLQTMKQINDFALSNNREPTPAELNKLLEAERVRTGSSATLPAGTTTNSVGVMRQENVVKPTISLQYLQQVRGG